MKALNIITLLLVVVGAVNWGLIGLFQFDLVAALFGGQSAALSRIVYAIVGMSGIYQFLTLTGATAGSTGEGSVASHSHQ